MDIKTEFGIDDVVYTASAQGTDRKIIKYIKLSKKAIEYGFAPSRVGWMWTFGDETPYFNSSDVFATEEAAEKSHKLQKAKYESEQAKKKKFEKVEKLKALELEKFRLENDIDSDDE